VHFRSYIVLFIALLCGEVAFAQSYNHWTRSFNEESSLLGGAVVGGGAGPSAIYYNPAGIAEIRESKLSFHASLFSYRFYNVQNALGDDNHLKWSTLQIEPRFLSYMIQPKKHPDWSFELAFLNNENYRIDMTHAVDERIDILKSVPGDERYFATFQFLNTFRDDWIGAGWSWMINSRLFVGTSMFVMIRQTQYSYSLMIEAYPVDSVVGVNSNDYYTASYEKTEYLKYNDYRLIWKFGLMYKQDRFSVGLNLTTPSLGGIYSDGKRVSRRRSQSNITNPETGEFLPDYFVGDYKDKKDVDVDHKSPISLAAGLTWFSKDKKQIFYSTLEYFGDIETYRLVEANEGLNIATQTIPNTIPLNEWLTFISGANPVLNAAFGYSWTINEQLLLMAGVRTDFNYIKDYDYSPYSEDKAIKGIAVDNYHISGGLSWNVWGQDLITGLQYTLGKETGQRQIVNLSDPVEYNVDEQAPLQGTRQNNMSSLINSLSIYVGATFNFGNP